MSKLPLFVFHGLLMTHTKMDCLLKVDLQYTNRVYLESINVAVGSYCFCT